MCHRLVDRLEETYTVEVLEGWKRDAEDLARREIESGRCAAASSRLFNVPDPLSRFVGRKSELDRLGSLVVREPANIAINSSIAGLAGIGKTETAIMLAHKLAEEGMFPGGIFWLPAERLDLTSTWASAEIAGALGVSGEDAAMTARNTVARLSDTDERVLVILDNVTQWSKGRKPAPLPSGRHVQMLATSRERDLGYEFQPFDLGFLDSEAARNLLLKISQRSVDPGLDELLEHLGGHALAVELAGSYLRAAGGKSAAEYLSDLLMGDELNTRVASKGRYEGTVTQALRTVWESLDERARCAWLIASCFAPAPVGHEISDAAGLDEHARMTLLQYHVIRYVGRKWSMHRLVRAFGSGAGADVERKQADRRFQRACSTFVESFDTHPMGYRRYLSEQVHLELFAERLAARPLDEVSCSILARVATGRASAGDLRGAVKMHKSILDASKRLYGDQSRNTLAALGNLALTIHGQGDFEGARKLQEEVLRGLDSLDHTQPVDRATAMNNLALTLRSLAEYGQAENLHLEVIRICDQELGESDRNTLSSRESLALTLDAQGRSSEARKLHEQVLGMCTEALGQEHPDTVRTKGNLALTLYNQHDFEGAKKLQCEVVRYCKRKLGVDQLDTLTSMGNLAKTLVALGDWDQAESLQETVLEYYRVRVGSIHPDVCDAMENLAKTLRLRGQVNRAGELEREAKGVRTSLQERSR